MRRCYSIIPIKPGEGLAKVKVEDEKDTIWIMNDDIIEKRLSSANLDTIPEFLDLLEEICALNDSFLLPNQIKRISTIIKERLNQDMEENT